jgi:hypothetical protein
MSRLAALCCCARGGGVENCQQWVAGCFPSFPKTVTVTFSGTALVEYVDTCSGIVTGTDSWSFGGSVTGPLLGPNGPPGEDTNARLGGTANATQTVNSKINEYNGSACGIWRECYTQSFQFGTCSVPLIGGQYAIGLSCIGGFTAGDNRWGLNVSFQGSGLYQSSSVGTCCNPGCNPVSITRSVQINVVGEFPYGCNPGSCNDCISIGFGADSTGYAGPIPIGSGFEDYTDSLGYRITRTGSISIAFT